MTTPTCPTSRFRLSYSNKTRLGLLVGFVVIATTVLSSTTFAGSLSQKLFAGAASMISGSKSANEAHSAANHSLALESTEAAAESSTMTVARRGHTATRLSDGRVLIAGGENSSGALNQSEIYDPATATFSAAANMTAARVDHTATLLGDGRVLIAGGRNDAGALTTTEIFDPTTGTFTNGPSMNVARTGHSATLFANGRVFVAGGESGGSAEILDLAAGTSNAAGAMGIARSMHSAALLQDGRVLVVGGRDANGNQLDSGEIFDTPASAFWTIGNALKVTRVRAHLRVLFDGKVQIIGGSNDGSMEIYDPVFEGFGAYVHVVPESDPCVGLSGQILISQTRAALFRPGQTDPLLDRSGHTITELNGQALVLGGVNGSGTVLNSSSILTSSSASITTEKIDYSPDETAHISGRGFQPGETVRVKIHEDPHTPQERGFDAVADAQGNFSGEYLVQDYDLDMKFIVGARGLSSGATAQTTFTDARLNTLTVGAQTPNPVTAGSSATYPVTVGFNGNANNCTVDLSVSGLPTGATGSFSPNPVTGSGTVDINSTLTINTTGSTPAGTTTFTVSAATRAGCQNHPATLTANGTLVVQANTFSITFDATPIGDVPGGTTVLSVTIGGGPATLVTKAELPKTFSGIATGTNISYSYNSPLAVSGSKQYRWLSTAGTGSAAGQTTQSGGPFSLTANSTVTATYQAQFLQTFTHTGLTADATGTVVTVDAAAKTFADLPFSKFVDAGATVSYSFNDPVTSSVSGKRYRLDSVTGPTTGYTVSGANTVTGNYVAQFLQTFTHTGLTADATGTVVTVDAAAKTFADLPFSKFVDAGTTVSYSFNDPVTSSVSGKQYRLDSVTGPTTGYTVSGANTVTGNYVAQFLQTFTHTGLTADATGTVVTVDAATKTFADLPFSKFVDAGTTVSYSFNDPVTSSVSGKQYRLDSVTGPTTGYTVSAANTVTGNYMAQFLQTFTHTGLTADATGTVVTVDAATKTFADLPFSKFVDAGATVSYSFNDPVTSSVSGKRYRLDSVTGPTTGYTVSGANTVTGNYVAQFLQTFTHTGLTADATGTVVTVDAAAKTFADLPFSKFVDAGTTVSYSFNDPVTSSVSGKQYRLDSVTGPTTGYTVSGANTVTGNYVAQFLQTFTHTGLTADATGTVVTVDAAAKSFADLPFSKFVDAGATVSYLFNDPVTSSVSGKQYRLDSVTGPTTGYTVSGANTVTGNYVAQWLLTFAQSGIGTDTGNNTVVTIGATPKAKGDLPFSEWFDHGSTLTYTYSTPVNTDPVSTKRYRLTSVTGITSGSTVTAASTITGNYIVQWQLTFAQIGIGSDTGTNTVVTIGASSKTRSDLPFSDWFDNGTTVTYAYSTPVNTDPASTKRYKLTSVTGIISGSTVTAASTITGNYVIQWQLTFTATGIPIGGASQTGANTVVTIDGNPKTAAMLAFSDWFDNGTSVSYVYSTPISTDPVSATQYELTNAASLPPSPITVSSGMTITGDYSTNTYSIHYLSPLDESTSSTYLVNTGKNGRVIPVKVQIFKNGTPIETGTVIMRVVGSNCAAGSGPAPIEEYADAGSSNGNTNLFRFTVGSPGFWIYNLDTKALGLSTNGCYRLDVYLGAISGPTSIKLSTNVWALFKPIK